MESCSSPRRFENYIAKKLAMKANRMLGPNISTYFMLLAETAMKHMIKQIDVEAK